jgi:hypothetical protein
MPKFTSYLINMDFWKRFSDKTTAHFLESLRTINPPTFVNAMSLSISFVGTRLIFCWTCNDSKCLIKKTAGNGTSK